jgi:hypothetical protein
MYTVDRLFVLNASPVYNLGIFDCLPGMIQYDEQNRTIIPFTNCSSLRVTGHLLETAERVSGLDLSLDHKGSRVDWRIEYEYEHNPNVPREMPSRATAIVLSGSAAGPQYTVKYLSLVLSDKPLKQSSFDASELLKDRLEVRVIQNKSYAKDTRTGQWRLTSSTDAEPSVLRLIFRATIFLIILFTLCGVWLLRRSKPQNGVKL